MSDTYRKEYTSLNDAQETQRLDVKKQAEELEAIYNAALANGYDPRLIAIAKTYLEISVMLAVKAIQGEAKPKVWFLYLGTSVSLSRATKAE